jgi:hypothetical protein
MDPNERSAMSWRLIFGLSLFGLAMGLAPIFLIPRQIEPHLWLGIFAVSAVAIAKRAPSKYFLHGLGVGLVNGFWVTAAHAALFEQSVVIHGRVVELSARVGAPHVAMALGGPIVGVAGGIVLGVAAWGVSKFLVSSHSEFAGW